MTAPEATASDVARAKAMIAALQRKGEWSGGVNAHVAYRTKPVDWIVQYLGIPEETIRWSLNPEYQACHCPRCVKAGNEGQPHLWDGDVDPLVKALELLFAGKSIAVSSGTTTGKTFTLGACGTLCFLAVFQHANVFSVAPKYDLLLKNMWKEIGQLSRTFKKWFPDAQMLSGQLRMLSGEGQEELWSASAFGAGVGAEEELAQRLKGFHRQHMLWIIEEGPGVDQAMIETIVKTSSSEFNPILMMGNPEHQHDTLAQFGKRPWVTPIRISALDFPNVVCDREVIPGGRSRQSVQRDLEDALGNEDDPKYLSQVRGIAPAQSSRALIRWEWCEAAAARWKDDAFRQGPPALGYDVADSPTGDPSARARWKGACCTDVEEFRADDAGEVGRIIYAEMMDPNNPVDPRNVGIDPVGVGASTINELKRLGVRVPNVDARRKPIPRLDVESLWSETKRSEDGRVLPAGPRVIETERYANRRSQMLWLLREDIRLGRAALPQDKLLFEELTAMEYEEPNGLITVEIKDKIRARIKRSPNRAEAVALGNFVRRRVPVKVEAAPEPEERNRDYGLEKVLRRRAKQQEAEDRRAQRRLARQRSRDRRMT